MTAAITVPATAEASAYLMRIARTMTDLFEVPIDDAVARINEFWSGHRFLRESEEDALFHELPDFWARTIYHGPDVQWWLDDQ